MLLNAVSSLCMLLLLGAAFGALGFRLHRRGGLLLVLGLWFGVAIGVGAAGTARSAYLTRGLRYAPAHDHPLWMFVLLAIALLLIFAPATLMLARGSAPGTGVAARRAAFLIIPGVMLATLTGPLLEIAGFAFLPPL
jgi:hypothetical protein